MDLMSLLNLVIPEIEAKNKVKHESTSLITENNLKNILCFTTVMYFPVLSNCHLGQYDFSMINVLLLNEVGLLGHTN